MFQVVSRGWLGLEVSEVGERHGQECGQRVVEEPGQREGEDPDHREALLPY